jgi:hypothetical protein
MGWDPKFESEDMKDGQSVMAAEFLVPLLLAG